MEHILYDFRLSLNEIILHIASDLPLTATDALRPFCVEMGKPDFYIRVRGVERMPKLPPDAAGSDLLLDYYQIGGLYYAAAKPGTAGPATITEYTADFSRATVYVNEREFPGVIRTVDKILQLFPIRRLLAGRGAMVLHSSRVRAGDKAILFTAASGTGKSTQAELWRQYEGSDVLCGDRTLLRKQDGGFSTCGFPVDGSNPVYSNTRLELGAVVALRQGRDNQVRRLSAFSALKYLMDQTVLDVWDAEEIGTVRGLWMDLLERYPVYLLECRPDQGAVDCLKRQLLRDEVI